MPCDYGALWNLICEEPYASLSDEDCAAACNDGVGTYAVTVIEPTKIDELDVLGAFADPADGEALLQKLEAVAESNAVVKRALKNLPQGEGGVDVGHSLVRATLDALVGTAGITQEEIDAIKSLAETKRSPAANVGLAKIRPGYVAKARAQHGV